MNIPNKFHFVFSHLRFRTLFKTVLRNVVSLNHYYILNIHLNRLDQPKVRRVKYSLRKIRESDIKTIIDQLHAFSPQDRKEIIIRLFFYQTGFKNCFIALNNKDEICYMQWLIYPHENEIIERHFKNRFYLLRDRQVMIENSFTFPKFRGRGLLLHVTYDLLSKARDEGYSNAIGYIRKDIIYSLNDFVKLGFKIQKMVREYKLFGFTKRML